MLWSLRALYTRVRPFNFLIWPWMGSILSEIFIFSKSEYATLTHDIRLFLYFRILVKRDFICENLPVIWASIGSHYFGKSQQLSRIFKENILSCAERTSLLLTSFELIVEATLYIFFKSCGKMVWIPYRIFSWIVEATSLQLIS